ncbi:uncharacterized protein LOC121804097 [Salvia splendens]|uniref:uncharacterized protein LOC121804097 n=1 Tax=Salvia splendens TaxID=180675 RepID=UPI001C270DE0|nr:uncharacterized protein LOC121804097 [Salvia splendens]
MAIFGAAYLRKTTASDCQSLLAMHGREHGFSGMMDNIDCMHLEWRKCLVAWKGQFTTGFKCKHPMMILEAIADYRQWIWHAYFGVIGSNNDINVLQSSPLFNEQCWGEGLQISFVANGRHYNRGYYLEDEIYLRWPIFLKSEEILVHAMARGCEEGC